MLEIHLLLIFMIGAAIIAVEMKDLLSSVIAVGAVGISLSLAFLLLKAPDLAILQLVAEILCLIILIRATARKDLPFSASGRWVFNTLATLAFLVVFLRLAWVSIKCIPSFGNPAMRQSALYVEEGAAGTMNVVAVIALKYRVLDTLAEVAVLFAAMIGVLSIVRKTGREKE